MNERLKSMRVNIAAVVTGIVILAGFSMPPSFVYEMLLPEEGVNFLPSDPVIHVFFLGLFTIVLGMPDLRSGRNLRAVMLGKTGGAAWLFGFFVEIWQAILPYRGFDVMDIIWDGGGVLCGGIVLILWKAGRTVWRNKTAAACRPQGHKQPRAEHP